ncbi:MAG TPA: AraC family transcriptional regulator [Acetobacteraceae bacterium]|nr:AraC family transcriptional regulator [Acetobacteraceae bacterium]
MGVTQMIHGYGQIHSYNQSTFDLASEHSSLAVVTGFLDAALRMWDDDRIQAKSQIKVAAAMLRSYADDAPAGEKPAATPSDLRGLAPWQTRKVKEFIDASLGSTIRLQDCASKARLSASYFSHAFKATFGTTVCHYIRCRRVERAQRLMLTSNEPLSQIALACGFADQAHYCRVFRDVVGLSPNAWRRRNMTLAPNE